MSRTSAALVPRKISVSNQVRWEVRVPVELRQQEKATRRRFRREAEAKGYCNRLKGNLFSYSDKARGLTDAQKIEAQVCFSRLGAYPAATLTQAVDLLLNRLDRAVPPHPTRSHAKLTRRAVLRPISHASTTVTLTQLTPG